MSFHHIAIDDGGMASLEFGRYPITGFYRCQVVRIFYLYGKAVFLDILTPGATAASGRRLINGDLQC
jgi:hypothetical protein